MLNRIEIVTALHNSTQRNYLARMADEKVEAMKVAREYEIEYWDGDRRYGYGGYTFREGYWRPVAERLVERFELQSDAAILDVGCGKAFLLYELQLILPDARIVGVDRSQHGLNSRHHSARGEFIQLRVEEGLPFKEGEFDLVISLATLHNLRLPELFFSLQEITRVGRKKYCMVESYRNELELFNLQCWALTAESFFHVDEWEWILASAGYDGDYEFIFFE